MRKDITHAKPLMKKLNILNVYQLNIIQTATFMLKVKLNLAPNVFSETFNEIKHKYPTNYSANNFLIPQKQLKVSKFSISVRGPKIWNNFLSNQTKSINSLSLFKTTIPGSLYSRKPQCIMVTVFERRRKQTWPRREWKLQCI